MVVLSPAQAARAASAYRALLRAQRFTFKGDQFAIQAGHQQTRILFNQFIPSASAANAPPLASTSKPHTLLHKTPETPKALTAEEVDEHISSAFEIATYLRKNVVQGVRNDEGNYSLRITEETERGDNNTIKAPSKQEARPLRPPTEGNPNAGVRRRRRAKPTPEAAAEAAPAPGGCCGGGGAQTPGP